MTSTPPTEPGSAGPVATQSGDSFPLWISRVAALIIDGIPVSILYTILSVVVGSSDGSFGVAGAALIAYVVLAIGWVVYNSGYRQGTTGQSIGKSVLRITVVGASTGQPIGFGRSIVRIFAHFLDALPCYLGYLWPLWDKENRTFADMIQQTRVVKR